MLSLIKVFTVVSAFLAVTTAHAASANDLTHLQRDACEFWGIGEVEGTIQTCSQVYTCRNGYEYVFKYKLSGGSQTRLTAFCKIESSGSKQACEQDRLTYDLANCLNDAIDSGILRNHKKVQVPTPGFVPSARDNFPATSGVN